MIKLEFEKDYSTYFASHGLKSFDDFFTFSKGSLIGKNKKRDVTALSLEDENGKKDFFMKRFIRPHFKDMVFAGINSGHICSQGQYEWKNAKYLLDNNIKTYHPACFGSKIKFGIESRSFFITEKLTGQCLKDFITENWNDLSEEDKKAVIQNIGRFVRKVHNTGVNFPDFYVWHLYLENNDPATCDFALIDLHRMTSQKVKSQQIVRNLAAMDYSMTDKYFDDEIRHSFIEGYLGTSDSKQIKSLYDKMKRWSNVLRDRRHTPNY